MFENVHVDTNGFFSTDCRVAVFSKWSSDIQKKYLKITGNYMSKFWKFIITGFMIVTGSLNGLFYAVKGQEAEKVDFVNLSSHGPLKITELTVNSEKIGLYEKFEISFDLEGEWDNPFDPDQIKVDAHFYSPDGQKIIVPGFFYQDYYQNLNKRLEKAGIPVWKIRFTPVM